ncbi:MAG TPA: MFS transporter [Atribacterota bacterium]|nr:MFS transporter [Atribacterota bacterium]
MVSLFADMNYEGGRSVVGQYLVFLGTSAFALGFAAGMGEFVGYALRFISGTIADKTKKYWIIIIVGYIVQLCSLPMIGLLTSWKLAIVFIFLERVGKAIRKPAVDAVISFASKKTGSGFGFGLHEAMDQLGAFLGPALFSILLFTTRTNSELETYRTGLLYLFIPAGMAILVTILARFLFPHPEHFEIKTEMPKISEKGYSYQYWIVVIAAGLMALGITDFPLIGLYLKKAGTFTEEAIPLLYAGAMAIDAAAAVVFGFIYDKIGLKSLSFLFFVEIFTAPLVFLGHFWLIMFGMALWGISVGTQESILKAAISDSVFSDKRASAFGLFNMIFGLCWFVGSAIIGLLYDKVGIQYMVIFSVAVQSGAFALFLYSIRKNRSIQE